MGYLKVAFIELSVVFMSISGFCISTNNFLNNILTADLPDNRFDKKDQPYGFYIFSMCLKAPICS